MAAKKKSSVKMAKNTVKTVKAKAPKKMNFKQAQKRALALMADWYSRNEPQVEKFLEHLEKVLVDFNKATPPSALPYAVPFPAVGDAVPVNPTVGMMGQAAPWTEEPKPVPAAPAEPVQEAKSVPPLPFTL